MFTIFELKHVKVANKLVICVQSILSTNFEFPEISIKPICSLCIDTVKVNGHLHWCNCDCIQYSVLKYQKFNYYLMQICSVLWFSIKYVERIDLRILDPQSFNIKSIFSIFDLYNCVPKVLWWPPETNRRGIAVVARSKFKVYCKVLPFFQERSCLTWRFDFRKK